jgi:hypothetical protein
MLHSHKWKQSGTISLWRYLENQKNFSGWHLTADTSGCASLIALLDAFALDGVPNSRALSIIQPSLAELSVPSNRSSAIGAPANLRLAFSEEHDAWSFPAELDVAQLIFGSKWLIPLKEAIAGIPSGKGDFSIGPLPGERLWFWWQPGAT